jgi:hypothetical protein
MRYGTNRQAHIAAPVLNSTITVRAGGTQLNALHICQAHIYLRGREASNQIQHMRGDLRT